MENIIEKNILKKVTGKEKFEECALNIRKNGKLLERTVSKNINITSKTDKDGIDITIKENIKGEKVYIPVIITKGGIKDKVYNDFYIEKNADVTIIAGCGVHNDEDLSTHEGIHTFYLEEGAKVKYIEKHYGEGKGKKEMNPITVVNLKENSFFEMQTVQIQGIESTVRETTVNLEKGSTFIANEKIMTTNSQFAKTIFTVNLNGEKSTAHVSSRAIAKDSSIQEFFSDVNGNTECFAHVECDAIIMDNAKVIAVPKIAANNVNANLIHEAAIGKIANEQLIKLMTLGLTPKKAEEHIIEGFLK